ncbi:MoaD/ThiS family protein [Spirochaetota bacterium]
MKITVKLFATLREYGQKMMELELTDEASPASIIRELNIPANEVAVIMINGRHVSRDEALKEADVLALFPALGGG